MLELEFWENFADQALFRPAKELCCLKDDLNFINFKNKSFFKIHLKYKSLINLRHNIVFLEFTQILEKNYIFSFGSHLVFN